MQKPDNPHPLPEAKTKEQIAIELRMSLRTFQRKLQKAGLKIPRGYISPETRKLILERLGWKPVS